MNGTVLCHYASKYYDPVKAHEYYEEHKKLKGRTSTAGLNDEGKIAAAYIKKSINDERDSKIESLKTETQSQIEKNSNDFDAFKAQRESEFRQHTEQAQREIDSIRDRISKMTDHQKKLAGKVLQSQINHIRDNNNAQREKITTDISNLRQSNAEKRRSLQEQLKNDTSSTREEYKNKYISELDKLKSNSQYSTTKKKSGSYGPGHSKVFEQVEEAIKNRKMKYT